jgi:hypothetical protein
MLGMISISAMDEKNGISADQCSKRKHIIGLKSPNLLSIQEKAPKEALAPVKSGGWLGSGDFLQVSLSSFFHFQPHDSPPHYPSSRPSWLRYHSLIAPFRSTAKRYQAVHHGHFYISLNPGSFLHAASHCHSMAWS